MSIYGSLLNIHSNAQSKSVPKTLNFCTSKSPEGVAFKGYQPGLHQSIQIAHDSLVNPTASEDSKKNEGKTTAKRCEHKMLIKIEVCMCECRYLYRNT